MNVLVGGTVGTRVHIIIAHGWMRGGGGLKR